MLPKHRRLFIAGGATAALTLGLVACGSGDDALEETAAEPATIEIVDNHGTQTVATPPTNVVATDNRTFELLDSWGVELSAGAVALMPADLSYTTDGSVIDLGTHNEPDLEAVVAAEPDLIVNGQRFSQYYEDFRKLVPDAAIVELDPRDGEPFADELKRQTSALGEIFGHEEDAQQLIEDFDASIERVIAAYDPADTVMSVLTSGGEISYVAPSTGRTLGPLYDILGLTPALEVAAEDESHGDDISVEAIAEADPDWILVMDRDAGTSANSGEAYTPADELLANSQALQSTTAVREGQIVHAPQDTYLNEGMQTYTEYFNDLADAMEASS
jgi:iron complex transport system substrate-binding protein